MKYQNIWGVGRNFKDHAKEMRTEAPSSPMIFLKSGASVNQQSHQIQLPTWVKEVHHEVELAVQISERGIPLNGTLSLDLTERYYQNLAKQNGHPWTLAKSFKGATALGPWLKWDPSFLESEIQLEVNGLLKQSGSMRDLVFSLEQIISFLLEHFPVCEGDVILLGTPSGVGPLKNGDLAKASLGHHLTHEWRMVPGPVS
jgi:2-keto-4-pentenoate hydratase/2-oxohepta-3-ene-1,7-dioic acid hydratase in catechol pathway